MEFMHERPYMALYYGLQCLEGMEDLEDEYNRLAARLEREFENVPEEEGCKHLGSLLYWYTGICRDGGNWRLMLKPWESEWANQPEPAPEAAPLSLQDALLIDDTGEKRRTSRKQPNPMNPTAIMRDVLTSWHMWYLQYAMHCKRRIKPDHCAIDQSLPTLAILEQLSQEEIATIGLGHEVNEHFNVLNHFIRIVASFRHRLEDLRYHPTFPVFFLNENDFAAIDDMVARAGNDEIVARNWICRYLQDLQPTEDHVSFEIRRDRVFRLAKHDSRYHTWSTYDPLPAADVVAYLRENFLDKAPDYGTQRLLHMMGLSRVEPTAPLSRRSKGGKAADQPTVVEVLEAELAAMPADSPPADQLPILDL